MNKNPLAIALAVLTAVQTVNLGTSLGGAGLPARYVVLFGALVSVAQLALTAYQHGATAPQSPVAATAAPVATPVQEAAPAA